MKYALITGASKRIGKQIAQKLHNKYNIILHYNSSQQQARLLQAELNKIRKNSATIVKADLTNEAELNSMCHNIDDLSVLVNNASVFYPTTINAITTTKFNNILATNVLAPLLLSKNLYPLLKKNNGNIVNIVDIHAIRPLKNHIIYNISKAAMYMLTQTLAKDLAPNIRVNGISPGSILWPEHDTTFNKKNIINATSLKKQGDLADIASAVEFVISNNYIHGQVINIDGGRTLNQ